MASGITIERPARNDARFRILGKRLGTDRHHAMGKMAELWFECLEKQTYFLKAAVIDALTEVDGFADQIADPEVDLAEKTDQGYRIKGVQGRIEWLGVRRENGSKRKQTECKPNANYEQNESEADAKRVPSSSTSSFSSSLKKGEEEKTPPSGGILVDLWQKHSGTLPKILGTNLTSNEFKKIRERLEENSDPPYWEGLIKKLASTPFFCGENNRKWKADFLWLIEPGNHVKLATRDYSNGGDAAALDMSRWT